MSSLRAVLEILTFKPGMRIREDSMDTLRRGAKISSKHLKILGDEVAASSPYGHIMSDLLTIREKSILMNLLEPHCKFIKTTVAQILQAKDTRGESSGWRRVDCGVLCLTENASVSSYFLRLYSIACAELLWEQELFIPLKYNARCAYFHAFPAETYQVGINFANETEAEEFHLAVEDVHKMMTTMINTTRKEIESKPSSNPPILEKTLEESYYEEPVSFADPINTSSFSGLESALSRLLMQVKISEEDLKNKDVTEVVDCIIKQFGGIKAVQKELKSKGTASKTLPRAAGASISAALQKGPLPPIPSFQSSTNSLHTSQNTAAQNTYQLVSSLPTSSTSGRMRRSASYKDVGSSAAAEGGDLLVALREVFKQKKMLQQSSTESPDETD